MALSQEDINIVIQEVSVGVNACDNAAIAMIGWDLVVYFLEELEYVWKGRRNFITLLYAVTRYGILLELLLQLFFPTHSLRTIPSCRRYVWLQNVVDMFFNFMFAAVLCLRTWAICRKSWLPNIAVLATSLAVPCLNIYFYTIPRHYIIVPDGRLRGCYISMGDDILSLYLPVISRICALISDALVITITWLKTSQIIGQGVEIPLGERLLDLLVRNGSIHFVSLLLLNATTIAFTVSQVFPGNGGSTTNFIYIEKAMFSILISHFLLDLRGAFKSDLNQLPGYGTETIPISSIRFTSVIDDMGIILNTPWADDEDDDGTNDRSEEMALTFPKLPGETESQATDDTSFV